MNFSFIGTALAQTAEQQKDPPFYMHLILPLGIILIMYFFLIRPQQKKVKEHAALVGGLKVGDEVVTTGGIIGKVRSIADTFISVEIAPNTTVKILKSNVAGMTIKPQPDQQKAPVKA